MTRPEVIALVGVGFTALGATAGVIKTYLTLRDRKSKRKTEGAQP